MFFVVVGGDSVEPETARAAKRLLKDGAVFGGDMGDERARASGVDSLSTPGAGDGVGVWCYEGAGEDDVLHGVHVGVGGGVLVVGLYGGDVVEPEKKIGVVGEVAGVGNLLGVDGVVVLLHVGVEGGGDGGLFHEVDGGERGAPWFELAAVGAGDWLWAA